MKVPPHDFLQKAKLIPMCGKTYATGYGGILNSIALEYNLDAFSFHYGCRIDNAKLSSSTYSYYKGIGMSKYIFFGQTSCNNEEIYRRRLQKALEQKHGVELSMCQTFDFNKKGVNYTNEIFNYINFQEVYYDCERWRKYGISDKCLQKVLPMYDHIWQLVLQKQNTWKY